METPPKFDNNFRDDLVELMRWRRDVRRFRTDPIAEDVIQEMLATIRLAPSVGNSQPWRLVIVDDPDRRAAVRDNFRRCNADAVNDYEGSRANLYAKLKLEGMDRAPLQIAAFCDVTTSVGFGLGSKTMPETLSYSVVGAIQSLWLVARSHGIGMGWVSILDPADMAENLDVPKDWRFIAYLCLGYPEQEQTEPELQKLGWQDRLNLSTFLFRR